MLCKHGDRLGTAGPVRELGVRPPGEEEDGGAGEGDLAGGGTGVGMGERLEGVVRVRDICAQNLLDNLDLDEKLDCRHTGLAVVVVARFALALALALAAETTLEEAGGECFPLFRAKHIAEKVLGVWICDWGSSGLGRLGERTRLWIGQRDAAVGNMKTDAPCCQS